MSEHLAAGIIQLDPKRFSFEGPPRAMSIERASRIAHAFLDKGEPVSVARQFLNAYGFDFEPVFAVIEGGKGKSDG